MDRKKLYRPAIMSIKNVVCNENGLGQCEITGYFELVLAGFEVYVGDPAVSLLYNSISYAADQVTFMSGAGTLAEPYVWRFTKNNMDCGRTYTVNASISIQITEQKNAPAVSVVCD